VDVGSRDGDRCLDRDSDGFLWKSEGEGLINRMLERRRRKGDEVTGMAELTVLDMTMDE